MKIITHDGMFRAGNVFAVSAAKIVFPNVDVIRVNNANDIATEGDLVIGTGCVYDPKNGKFDHHQLGGVQIDNIPYATFGLVWRSYGEIIVRVLWGELTALHGPDDKYVILVAEKVGERLVKSVDCYDLGSTKYGIDQLIYDFNSPIHHNSHFPFYEKDEGFIKALAFADGVLRRSVLSEIFQAIEALKNRSVQCLGRTNC